MNEKKKKICFTLQAQALEFVVTGILGNGSERGKKESPKDTGIGDGVGLHCGRDHGTQALPQEESNQLSNAALASCVCVLHPQTGAGSQINRHLKEVYDMKDTPKRSKHGETDYPEKKKHYQTNI